MQIQKTVAFHAKSNTRPVNNSSLRFQSETARLLHTEGIFLPSEKLTQAFLNSFERPNRLVANLLSPWFPSVAKALSPFKIGHRQLGYVSENHPDFKSVIRENIGSFVQSALILPLRLEALEGKPAIVMSEHGRLTPPFQEHLTQRLTVGNTLGFFTPAVVPLPRLPLKKLNRLMPELHQEMMAYVKTQWPIPDQFTPVFEPNRVVMQVVNS